MLHRLYFGTTFNNREEEQRMAVPGLVNDKVVVVTGAGGGIGREVALLMARQGAKVVVNDVGASATWVRPITTPRKWASWRCPSRSRSICRSTTCAPTAWRPSPTAA